VNANIPVNRVRIALVLALVAALALGSFWLLEVMRRNGEGPTRTLGKDESDYTVNQFTFLRLSEQGQVKYEVSGEKLTHYLNETYEITKPLVHAMSDHAAPVAVQAERALIDDTARKVHMYRNVKLDRPPSGNSGHLHMDSEYLMILPDDDVMQTDRQVDIQLGLTRLSGVGMFANNTTREFRLFNNVHGFFPSNTQ
jgi:lipopolysaccharide export system protein LptC